jgi:hypothetical protein
MESRKELFEDSLEARRLLGPVVAPSLMWLATLQQAWRFLHHDSRVTSPSLIPNYLNWSMVCFLQFRKYTFSDALAYVLALRSQLVTADLNDSLLDSLALLQGLVFPTP